jgi:hypothetical protein
LVVYFVNNAKNYLKTTRVGKNYETKN